MSGLKSILMVIALFLLGTLAAVASTHQQTAAEVFSADDLADIYRDLKEGLELYEAGHVAEALWEWSQSFNTHWGRHASSALHALQAYAADENIEL